MTRLLSKTKLVHYLLAGYAILLFCSQLVFLITNCKIQLHGNCDAVAEIVCNFHISDWLINYEGGFVRRGLMGEFLYWIYNLTHVNIPILITVSSFCLLLLFSILFARKWSQYRLSVVLLPSFILLGGLFGGNSFMWFRRDVLIFLLVWATFICYGNMLKNKKIYVFLFQIVAIITILSHEASFFYMLPIIACHYCFLNLRNHGWKYSLAKASMIALPSACTFFMCSLFKGNVETAHAIWNSWHPLFVQLGIGDVSLGMGPDALTWNTISTFKYHAYLNFIRCNYGIPSFMLWPIVYLAIIYLLVNANKIMLCPVKAKKPFSILKYLHILFIVAFFMLPMFTVLSCDNKRLMLYCTLSSFLFYFSMPQQMFGVFYHEKLSKALTKIYYFLTHGIFAKTYLFVLVLLFAGMPSVYFSIEGIFKSSMAGLPISLTKQALLILGVI